MLDKLKIDAFTRNIILVFAGTSLANFLNLAYQLLIAHSLTPADFASFNALLSFFMVITSPLNTAQMAVVKYSSEFNAKGQPEKVKFLLSGFFKKTVIAAVFTLLVFSLLSPFILSSFKIPAVSCGYIMALLFALSWLTPVFLGGLQGLEFFGWVASSSVIGGVSKLILTFIFIWLGYSISGALGALLISAGVTIVIAYLPLKRFISLKPGPAQGHFHYRELLLYLLPLGVSYFCFMNLVTSDMILVKLFFSENEAGIYSLAQMVGKIFLFLPAAISIVLFPRSSSLNARNIDTASTLNQSMRYVAGLSVAAVLFYNIFPGFVLKILTGKAYPESVSLGRLFSVSMAFFSLLYVLISYFLSIKDLRFIKYLVAATLLQALAIILFHRSLMQVQGLLCLNAVLLFLAHLWLAYGRKHPKIASVSI